MQTIERNRYIEKNRIGFVQKCEIDHSNVRGLQVEVEKRNTVINREK